MVRVRFNYRQRFRTRYGLTVIVPTPEEAADAIAAVTGEEPTEVEIIDVHEMTEKELTTRRDYERRLAEWHERAKTATAYRGLL